MEVELYKKVLNSLTDPAAIILFFVCLGLAREVLKRDSIIAKLLVAQETRGIVLAKMTLMLEHIFNRRGGQNDG